MEHMSIQWSEDLRTGIEEIDDQHKLLIKKIEELFIACRNGAGFEDAREMLEYVQDYCEEHFESEEAFMKSRGYSRLLSHLSIHAKFRQEMGEMKKEADKAGIGVDTIVRLNKKLVNWLIDHIRMTDKKMAEALREAE